MLNEAMAFEVKRHVSLLKFYMYCSKTCYLQFFSVKLADVSNNDSEYKYSSYTFNHCKNSSMNVTPFKAEIRIPSNKYICRVLICAFMYNY